MESNPINMSSRRCIINGRMVDIYTYDEYSNHPELARTAPSNTAISKISPSGKELILPYKGKVTNNVSEPVVPGVYDEGPIDLIVYPEACDESNYIPSEIVSFDNTDTIKERLDKQEKLSKMSEPWITTPDNVTEFTIEDTNQPEMIGLKTAINEKHIDFDKYSVRFGENFPNDKRQLKGDSITLNILKRFCRNLDLDAVLIFKDRSPDVPNPLGKEIKVSLTDSYDEGE